MARRTLLLTLAAALLLLTATLAPAAAQPPLAADITADTMTFDWGTDTFVFDGNARVVLAQPHQATLTGPRMTARFTGEMQAVELLEAQGPVRMELVSEPDARGMRYRIIASAQRQAVYSEARQKIVLSGAAEAEIVSLPEGPDSRRAHFQGETIEADLATSLLTVTQARLQVSTPVPPDEQP